MSGLQACQSWLSRKCEGSGTRAFVGNVEFGQAFSLALPGSSSAGNSRWLFLCCGKKNSLLILVFAFFLIAWG